MITKAQVVEMKKLHQQYLEALADGEKELADAYLDLIVEIQTQNIHDAE